MRSSEGDLNAYDYLQGMQHYVGTYCARRVQLEKELSDPLYRYPYSLAGVRDAYAEIVGSVNNDETQDVREATRRVACAEILRTMEAFTSSAPEGAQFRLDRFQPTVGHLEDMVNSACEFYLDRGLAIDPPKVTVSNRLPAPFDRGQASILAADAEDLTRFGIQPGLYFTPRALTPVFSDYTVAHELVHTYLGQVSPEIVADFFEEGVAEFLSLFDYSRIHLGEEVPIHILAINRLTSGVGLVWEHYLDGMRAALGICLRQGVSYIYGAMRGGREALESLSALTPFVDRSSLPGRGKFDMGWQGQVDGWEARATASGVAGLLGLPRSRIVSASAFLVAPFIKPGCTIREIAHEARVTQVMAEDAVSELEDGGYLVRRPDGIVVEYAQVEQYVQEGTLRYDFR